MKFLSLLSLCLSLLYAHAPDDTDEEIFPYNNEEWESYADGNCLIPLFLHGVDTVVVCKAQPKGVRCNYQDIYSLIMTEQVLLDYDVEIESGYSYDFYAMSTSKVYKQALNVNCE